jgi:hypothetical protein
MLFDHDRHEPLFEAEWDASRATEAVSVLVANMQDSLRYDAGWPVHPLDRKDEPRSGSSLSTLARPARYGRCGTWSVKRPSSFASNRAS